MRDDAKKNFKGQKEQEIKMPESLPEEPENNSKEKKKKKKEKKLISESESLPEEPENNSKEKKKKKKKKKLISESESLPEEPENNSKEKKKKKKKKKLTSESESLPSATEEKFKDASLEDRNVTDSKREKKTKDKEKKKKPPTSDSLGNNADSQATNSTVLNAHDTSVEGKSSKSKTKKKKKDDLAFESSGVNAKDTSVIGCTADDFKMSSAVAGANATGKDEKGSKKRKRLVSDENDLRPADKIEVEESKRRKIEGVENSVGNEQQAGIKKVDEFQNNSIKQLNDLENGSVVKSVEKSSVQKTTKKQPNGSAEPKTVCAFQRVKVDEVVFADEKLKDNSYWAKDGAETGYGAKAQEVLGQVRGRDFRHEKTKKKRGSYRGGQIDLQSHSVKFNYSDDE